jgi:hypothetical protein
VVPVSRSYKLPIRATLVVFITLVALLTAILRHFEAGMTTGELLALIALVSTAIVGDTVRPSGMAKQEAPEAKPEP